MWIPFWTWIRAEQIRDLILLKNFNVNVQSFRWIPYVLGSARHDDNINYYYDSVEYISLSIISKWLIKAYLNQIKEKLSTVIGVSSLIIGSSWKCEKIKLFTVNICDKIICLENKFICTFVSWFASIRNYSNWIFIPVYTHPIHIRIIKCQMESFGDAKNKDKNELGNCRPNKISN